jgi:hypothetical protein
VERRGGLAVLIGVVAAVAGGGYQPTTIDGTVQVTTDANCPRS